VLRFKLHALRTNEAFLLAADAVAAHLRPGAAAAQQGSRAAMAAAGAHGPTECAATWLRHFQPDGAGLWWDVARQPAAMVVAGVPAAVFRDSCRAHLTESAALLRSALAARAPALAALAEPLLAVDGFYGQLLGLFELYSMGLRVPSAAGPWCRRLVEVGGEAEKRDAAALVDVCVEAAPDDGSCGESCEDEDEDEEQGEGPTTAAPAKRQRREAGGEEDEEDEEDEELSVGRIDEYLAAAADGELLEFPPLDGTALYWRICKLNHSCEPNCGVLFEAGSAAARLVARRPGHEGAALSYVALPSSTRAGFSI
jgi:hypothetical protein